MTLAKLYKIYVFTWIKGILMNWAVNITENEENHTCPIATNQWLVPLCFPFFVSSSHGSDSKEGEQTGLVEWWCPIVSAEDWWPFKLTSLSPHNVKRSHYKGNHYWKRKVLKLADTMLNIEQYSFDLDLYRVPVLKVRSCASFRIMQGQWQSKMHPWKPGPGE